MCRGADGTLSRITIGQHGSLFAPDRARLKALELLAAIKLRGDNPAAAKRALRGAPTVCELLDEYVEAIESGRLLIGRTKKAKKRSTLATDKGRIEAHIRPLLERDRFRLHRFLSRDSRFGVIPFETITLWEQRRLPRSLCTTWKGWCTPSRSYWRRIATLGELPPDVTPHMLRHSFASLAADLGYSERTIAALIGHRGHTVTSRYVYRADAVANETCRRMSGPLGSGAVLQLHRTAAADESHQSQPATNPTFAYRRRPKCTSGLRKLAPYCIRRPGIRHRIKPSARESQRALI